MGCGPGNGRAWVEVETSWACGDVGGSTVLYCSADPTEVVLETTQGDTEPIARFENLRSRTTRWLFDVDDSETEFTVRATPRFSWERSGNPSYFGAAQIGQIEVDPLEHTFSFR